LRVTYSHVERTLLTHPDYPSLLALAESLTEWGVRTEGVRGTVAELSQVDYPSIVHLKSRRFAVLEKLENGRATLLEPGRNRLALSLEQFAEVWNGVLLRARAENGAGECDYRQHRRREILTGAVKLLVTVGLPTVFLMSLALGLVQQGMLGAAAPTVLTKLLGLIVCSVLAAGSLGAGDLLDSLCPMGRTANCHRVLASPAGRLIGVSMAEWGLLFFGGGLLAMLIGLSVGVLTDIMIWLALMNLLTLPYTIFSVIYQWLVVRSWCWLCLVVQGIFWLEFWLYESPLSSFEMALTPLPAAAVGLGFALAAAIWAALRRLVLESRRAKPLAFEAARLHSQPEFIQWKLGRIQKIDMGDMPIELELGSRSAEMTLTVVVNPLCGHCSRSFEQLADLRRVSRDNFKVVVRFLVAAQDPLQTTTERLLDREVSLRFLVLAEVGDQQRLEQALRAWFSPGEGFSRGRYRRWLDRFGLRPEAPSARFPAALESQRQWAVRAQVGATPTYFLNGRRLPPGFEPAHLKLLLVRQVQR